MILMFFRRHLDSIVKCIIYHISSICGATVATNCPFPKQIKQKFVFVTSIGPPYARTVVFHLILSAK